MSFASKLASTATMIVMVMIVAIVIDILVISSTILPIVVLHMLPELTSCVAHLEHDALFVNIVHDVLFSTIAQPVHLSTLESTVDLFLQKKRMKILVRLLIIFVESFFPPTHTVAPYDGSLPTGRHPNYMLITPL